MYRSSEVTHAWWVVLFCEENRKGVSLSEIDRTLLDVAGTSYESVLIFDAIVIYIWCLYENN